MKQYNKLFKWNKYNGNHIDYAGDGDGDEDGDNSSIAYGDSNKTNSYINKSDNIQILNTILRHPYMEKVDIDLKIDLGVHHGISNNYKNYLVIYRLNTYNTINHVAEFYILGTFLSVSRKESDDVLSHNNGDFAITGINTILHHVPGDKRIKGTTMFKDNNYTFIQVRNNKDTSNWLNIWDIVVNKHYFGERIDDLVIDFFKNNNDLTNLMLNQTICLKPIVLYSYVDERYHEYIKKNRSIQYCQNKIDSLIKLHHFNENDNVRTLCFIEDRDFSNTSHELICNHYIIKRETHDTQERVEWIFKSDNILFSSVK